jgi:hypothetical protein
LKKVYSGQQFAPQSDDVRFKKKFLRAETPDPFASFPVQRVKYQGTLSKQPESTPMEDGANALDNRSLS